MRVSQEQINAAAAVIRLARTAYLPHADGLAHVNHATRNNVFGLLLPQSAIPSCRRLHSGRREVPRKLTLNLG